LRYKDIASV